MENNAYISQGILNYFEAVVEKYPNEVAIVHGNSQLTYEELNQKSNQLAHYLLAEGIQKSDVVAAYLDASPKFIISILAIIKAGGVYLPLDTAAPDERNSTIIESANIRFVIFDNAKLEQFTNYHSIDFEKWDTTISPYATNDPRVLIKEEDPCYLMYTSGSTGTPKGVLIKHAGIINLLIDNVDSDIGPKDRVAQLSNIAFDGSAFAIWLALLNGATLYLILPQLLSSPSMLANYFKLNKINVTLFPTGFFNHFIEHNIEGIDEFKYIYFGGEEVNKDIVRRVLQRKEALNLNNLTIIHAYGPTESTVYALRYIIDSLSPDANDYELASIGKPIKNMKAYVLDKRKRPVKDGEAGELYLSGKSLAIGYRNNKSLTAKKFLKNPFESTDLYKVMYKTGDIVRKLDNEQYLYVERIDDQVKVNGYLTHISEIQHVLESHDKINQAVVLPNKVHGKYITMHAYIKLKRRKGQIRYDELKKYLVNKLPSYMIPSRFYILEKYPLTLTGKIDKRKLRESKELKVIAEETQKHGKTDDMKSKLIEILIKTAGVTSVNSEKNFFDMGIKSLSLSQICTEIQTTICPEIELMDIIQRPSVNLLLPYIIQTNAQNQKIRL